MVLNIEYTSETTWTEVCKKVKNALVFLDDCSAECLHWHGGLCRLINAGALGVKEFSSFEGGKQDEKKAVFLVKSPLVGAPRMILRDIISNSFFEHCVIITPCTPTVLNLATTGNVPDNSHELTALHKLEQDMIHWMKKHDCAAEIFHFPYAFVSLSDYFFITPAFNDFFPCFDEDLGIKKANYRTPEWDMESLPLEMQVTIVYLMTTLNNLLSQLNVREDIYCFGSLSSVVGSQLQKHSTSLLRSKTASSTASLLLIDRTLDMCNSVSFENSCFLDNMKRTLPSFPHQTIDVAVDISCLCASKEQGDDFSFPGCLHEPKVPMFEWLFHQNTSEILRGLSREICKALSIEERCFSPLELEKCIKNNFSQNYGLIRKHSGLLQLCLGVIQTLKSNSNEKTKLARSFQMLLMQSLSSDGNTDNAVEQIIDLINKRHNRGIDLDNILSTLVFFYSFIGDKYTINPDLETLIASALAKSFVEDIESYSKNGILDLESFSGNEGVLCDHIFKKLHSLKNARSNLLKYREVSVFEDPMMPLEYKSIIKQLFEDIINTNKPEIPDLRHKPNLSMRDNFASRFSMILNSARPRITDNESIIVFIIGGITGHEVTILKNFSKFYEKPIIIGSTALLSPSDVIKKLFVNNPLQPIVI